MSRYGRYNKSLTENLKYIMHLSHIYNQPENNTNRNCTAVFTSVGCRAKGWVAIDCHETFYTSLICKNTAIKTTDINSKDKARCDDPESCYFRLLPKSADNLICANGWLLIGEKCFNFFKFDKDASYNRAELECNKEDGVLITSKLDNNSPYTPSPYFSYSAVIPIFNVLAFDTKITFSIDDIFRIVVGIPLVSKSSYSTSAYIVNILILLTSEHGFAALPFIESGPTTQLCWLLDLSILGLYYGTVNTEDNRRVLAQYYGLKQRSCSSHLKSASFVCEKTPYKLKITCTLNQYQCKDYSCILLVYLCDSVLDCRSGEDEERCPEYKYDTDGMVIVANNFIQMIPCSSVQYVEGNQTRRPLFMYVPAHSLCDGQHICDIIKEDMCSYKTIEHLTLLVHGQFRMIKNDFTPPGINEYISNAFKQYLALKKGVTDLIKYTNNNSEEALPSRLFCSETDMYHDIKDFCFIQDIYPCSYGKHTSVVCKIIQCPGMFKCIYAFCIRLSAMCDGYIDCIDGEDELNCSNISCNGHLKCRNENRCIGLEQMCDGSVDCRYSSDDEVECDYCPADCICQGYTAQCSYLARHSQYRLSGLPYIKSLTIKGTLQSVILESSFSKHVVYMDISNLDMHWISSLKSIRREVYVNLLYVNISNNLIRDYQFVSDRLFNKLVMLDLSNNLLTFIGNITSKHLLNIAYFILDGNPIAYLKLGYFIKLDHINLLSITRVFFHQMRMIKELKLAVRFKLRVDDEHFCCYYEPQVRCVLPYTLRCHGLIHNKIHRTWFLVLTCMSFIGSNYLILNNLSSFNHTKRKYFVLIFINIGLSEMLSSAYLCCLGIANELYVNIVFWQKSVYCNILHALLMLSLEANIMLKAIASYILFVKIIYPFRHQCRHVNFTWLMCFLVWLILTIYYIIYISFMHGSYFYSSLCTSWCQTADDLDHLHIICSAVEWISLCFISLCLLFTYISLNQRSHVSSQERNYAAKISCPVLIQIIIDFFLRMPITTSLILHSTELSTKLYFCSFIILFALPLKIVLSSFYRIFVKTIYKCCNWSLTLCDTL